MLSRFLIKLVKYSKKQTKKHTKNKPKNRSSGRLMHLLVNDLQVYKIRYETSKNM